DGPRRPAPFGAVERSDRLGRHAAGASSPERFLTRWYHQEPGRVAPAANRSPGSAASGDRWAGGFGGGWSMHRQRVLITGVSRFWGAELAQHLEPNPLIEQIVGVDVREPTRELSRTDFVRADIRHSLIGKLVRALGIDTVVHTNLIVDPRRTSARIAHETNVIGTMNLLAACSGADSPVRKLVVKSSTAIYGSEPDDPSFWTEDMTRRTPPRDAFSRDIVEVESYVRD